MGCGRFRADCCVEARHGSRDRLFAPNLVTTALQEARHPTACALTQEDPNACNGSPWVRRAPILPGAGRSNLRKFRGIANGQLEAQLRRCHVGCHESPVQRQFHFGIRPALDEDESVAKQCRDGHPQRQCDVYASQIFQLGS